MSFQFPWWESSSESPKWVEFDSSAAGEIESRWNFTFPCAGLMCVCVWQMSHPSPMCSSEWVHQLCSPVEVNRPQRPGEEIWQHRRNPGGVFLARVGSEPAGFNSHRTEHWWTHLLVLQEAVAQLWFRGPYESVTEHKALLCDRIHSAYLSPDGSTMLIMKTMWSMKVLCKG